jgi:hypothetical protein
MVALDRWVAWVVHRRATPTVVAAVAAVAAVDAE